MSPPPRFYGDRVPAAADAESARPHGRGRTFDLRNAARVLAIVAALGSHTSLHAEKAGPVYVSVFFAAGTRTTPASDAPPRVSEALAIELPPKVAASAKPGTVGGLSIRVDEAGAVHDLSFDKTASPGALAQPIRQSLARWRFEPIRSGGKIQATTVPLIYIVRAVPKAVDEASRQVHPPIPLYWVAPEHIPALTRQPTKDVERHFPRYRPPIFRTTTVRLENGEVHTNTIRIDPPAEWHVESFERVLQPKVPWLDATVSLDYDIDRNGVARNIRIHESSCPLLEPEAVSALQAWRFKPSLVNDVPVGSRLREIMAFGISRNTSVPSFIRPLAVENRSRRWDEAPRFAVLSLPIYPTELAAQDIKGDATATVSLTETGTVHEVIVTDASREEFGHALRAAMFASRCVPARLNGNPVSTDFEITAGFTAKPETMAPDDPRLPAVVLTHSGEAPVNADALDARPRLVIGSKPRFRRHELATGETGSATLEVTIDQTGRVKNPLVVSTSHPSLAYMAIQASATWLFEPPTASGKPIAVRVRLPFVMQAADPEEPPPTE